MELKLERNTMKMAAVTYQKAKYQCPWTKP